MEEVKIVKKGRVLEILLNRPKVNAIDLATSRKLGEAFVLLRDDPELWVGVQKQRPNTEPVEEQTKKEETRQEVYNKFEQWN